MSAKFEAVIEDVRELRRVEGRALWQMALSETGFRAGDRGLLVAVSRSGSRIEIPVLSVTSDGDGRVWHEVEKPLAQGTTVTGQPAERAASEETSHG